MPALGYQLYASRNFGPLPVTCAMLAEAGYAHVEGYGALFDTDETVAELAHALDASGLTMPSVHFGLDAVEKSPGRMKEIAQRFGIESVFVPFIGTEQRPQTREAWRDFGARLHKAGAPLRDAGLTFGWHNHDFELDPLPDGTLPIEALLEGAPDLALELDIGWVARAGHDPLTLIARYAGRLAAVHLKDVAPPRSNADEDGWTDIGHGTLDWQAIAAALKKSDVRHLVAEHDNPSDDRRFAARSIAGLRQAWAEA
ncbi:MAG: sugar phosphate isomerase/epimerase [Roseitalea sp.]|jgi:sugar phosphate isomerase/epimerase|nr:sugar phosphate isomerase/epimerase [Roseitalea sp.]MBO6720227.1 sugar phosphate isomerase/epimerase [Roseitalea sp.]MBO6742587.1 sugar phosphate isomerase/epimerase [Roseitalea sp.]